MIKYYWREGIVEKVPESDEYKDPGTVHCLPHQAVIKNERETTKLRIVFDAASKIKNGLLNDNLLPSPSLLQWLYNIFIRFCIGKYGLMADIKQAFLQISLHEEHRDSVLFFIV